MMNAFNNFEELKNSNKELANELLERVGSGEWQEDTIYHFDCVEDFAEYELTEGWYANSELDKDWNGAPNPIDHINLTSLGEALTSTWDDSGNFLSSEDEVLTTGFGW